MEERFYMERALTLSKQGEFSAYPNPMVGAVIVKDGQIIGEGWHRGPGHPHAEVEALHSCHRDPAGATLYVTLEPCNHHGRTPPCTEAILKAGLSKVKMAVADPNPCVIGCGGSRLQAAGVVVERGLCRQEALELNRSFFYHALTKRPWVIMKSAASLDGKINGAAGETRWITGEASRKVVHGLRAQVGAILIGRGTLLQDNPALTNRFEPRGQRQPLKVLLDSSLQISETQRLVQENPENLLVFCNQQAPEVKINHLQALGVRVIQQATDGRIDLVKMLEHLGQNGVQSLLLEGGAQIYAAFIESGLVNEYYLFYAPIFIGGRATSLVADGVEIASRGEQPLLIKEVTYQGGDLLIRAYQEELSQCLPV